MKQQVWRTRRRARVGRGEEFGGVGGGVGRGGEAVKKEIVVRGVDL